ncbi:MAG: response regulator [Candidatus Parcubacteria bacterium]|nr:response regulator [Leptolyngbyaceae cyanobacterium LF-bin-113]
MNFSPSITSTDRILVVDDVADNSFLLQMLLEDEGYQVEVADSGAAALAKIESAPPKLVLLDVMMPGMNGYEVAQQIRENIELPFIPIVMVTGHDQPTVSKNVQVEGFLRKPIEFDELLSQVHAILERARKKTVERV